MYKGSWPAMEKGQSYYYYYYYGIEFTNMLGVAQHCGTQTRNVAKGP